MARNKAVLWQGTWDVCGVQRQLLTGCSLIRAAAVLPITVVHHCSCPAWQLSSVLVLQMAFLGVGTAWGAEELWSFGVLLLLSIQKYHIFPKFEGGVGKQVQELEF